jgi:hypothetical protein
MSGRRSPRYRTTSATGSGWLSVPQASAPKLPPPDARVLGIELNPARHEGPMLAGAAAFGV